ncbi:MAG: transcriptional regulator [Adlercreutzia mucosicola]|uniref:Transcriptional regulator n=1 Tax=Adlercreutzia mucosicola TaxID=580026 RepID=A0A6N8JKG7_9ACTN|nr:ATP-binding protein [Adlercreutzia mucosicola]MCI9494478.1 transcriptional regulator [Adlercreutzia mucosicola]MVX60142.1 transcriptional regulator [Adlercreutzia mucosicola]
MAITAEELEKIVARLRRQGSDDALVEVKACQNSLSKDVWESVCAFGNTRGGVVILGLAENDGFRPVENFKLEKVHDQFVSGLGDGSRMKEVIVNPPRYALSRIDFEGAQVLVIEVEEVPLRSKPCYLRDRGMANGSFRRLDDKDIKLSSTEIFELQNELVPSPADRGIVDEATVDDLDDNLVKRLIAKEKERNSRALRGVKTKAAQLARLNILTPDGRVRMGGLLSLGSYPQQFFPKLVIDVAAHPGLEKSEPDGPRFLDRVICEGSLGEMIEEAVQAIAKNLRTYSFVEGAGRRDELEIPRDVLREAVANAVVHREYGPYFTGQSVSVDVFLDRVEITNPGGLWGGKTLETLGDGQSRCRNDTLMKLVSRIEYPSEGAAAEGQGSGIRLMIREMRSRALDEPRFEAGLDYFRVVLQRGGAEIAANRTWLESLSKQPASKVDEAILLEAQRREAVSVRELHGFLGHDSDDIRAHLKRLEKEGMMKRLSKDRYCLVEKGKAAEKRARKSARDDILSALDKAGEPLSMKDIAELSGRKLSTLRAQMTRLVAEGAVQATAAAHSPDRKYRKG